MNNLKLTTMKKLMILAVAIVMGLGVTSCGPMFCDMPPGDYGYSYGPGDGPRGDRGPGGDRDFRGGDRGGGHYGGDYGRR